MQWKGSEEQRSSFGIERKQYRLVLRERQIEPHAVSEQHKEKDKESV